MTRRNHDLRVLVAQEVGEGRDAHDAATTAVDQLTPDQLRESVIPIAEGIARDVMRRNARTIEDDAFAISGEHDDLEAAISRDDLLATRFALPDGRWVLWSEATAEDHLARAAMQDGLARSCSVDAERHRQAAALIEQRGVTCLAEISEARDVA